jgi:demethylmenaquinone methyltransferase/2-methoxy-6-polyprenyl-1,4-benzoquinol methylase
MSAQQAVPEPFAGDKAEYVRRLFAGIAPRYDLLNSVLSFRRHLAWRRCAVKIAKVEPGDRALDICSGTGDLAVELYRRVGPSGLVAASDFCAPMLRLGKPKTDRASGGAIGLALADALRLPYRSGAFDCVTIGFGIRNVADMAVAFGEMARVLRPGGRAVCLEFNRPRNPLIRAVVGFYEGRVLPRIAGLLSRREAYEYLRRSIAQFHSREELSRMMAEAGFEDVQTKDLNFGSVCIHRGERA